MSIIKGLRTQFIEFLKQHYSDNSNESLAAHLTIIANADNNGTKVTVSERTVRYYARKLGLRKSQEYVHSKALGNSINERVKHIGDNFTFYSGNPADDVRKVETDKEHLLLCASKKQMQCIRNAAYRYNIKKSAKTGIRIKVSCDSERMSVLLIAETISQPDSCRTHSSPSEVQCVPP